MADQPYDPYIPNNGAAPGGAPGPGNQRTAAIQQVRCSLSRFLFLVRGVFVAGVAVAFAAMIAVAVAVAFAIVFALVPFCHSIRHRLRPCEAGLCPRPPAHTPAVSNIGKEATVSVGNCLVSL